jgi:hypothetical protein
LIICARLYRYGGGKPKAGKRRVPGTRLASSADSG